MNFCSPDMQNVSSRYKRFFPYINRNPLKQDRNMAIGAEWNSLTVGPVGSTISARITAQEKTQTQAGTFDTSVLGYTIGSNASRISLSHNIPLPVKAEVYNAQNELQYKYSLLYIKP